MNRVSIIGLGWLGKQLGTHLKKEGYTILGSTTSLSKIRGLKKEGFDAFLFNLKDSELESSVSKKLFQSDFFIITIPPSTLGSQYSIKLKKLVFDILKTNKSATIIYTSSISVYGNQSTAVDENTKVLPQSNNAKQIVDVEKFIKEKCSYSFSLRLGGLIGPNRHPVQFLSGRRELAKPHAPVNLIHVDEICNLISILLRNLTKETTINVVTPDHPTKEKYYTRVAMNRNLTLPKFVGTDMRKGKVVNSKILEGMMFNFKYASPFDYPQTCKDV